MRAAVHLLVDVRISSCDHTRMNSQPKASVPSRASGGTIIGALPFACGERSELLQAVKRRSDRAFPGSGSARRFASGDRAGYFSLLSSKDPLDCSLEDLPVVIDRDTSTNGVETCSVVCSLERFGAARLGPSEPSIPYGRGFKFLLR